MSTVSDEDITKLLDIQAPSSINLSVDGRTLVYATALDWNALHEDTEHRVSTIWHAESGKAGSAGPLTSGNYNDKQPRLSPDSKTIAFTSDRAKKGESCAIYALSLDGSEPHALTPALNEQSIETLKWSPDGAYLAYLSPDEKTAERKEKDKLKDDPYVFGQNWDHNRLRVLHVESKEIKTIASLDEHITAFDWSNDGKQLAFCTALDPSIESVYTAEQGIYTVAADGDALQKHATLPLFVSHIVYGTDALYFRSTVNQESISSAGTLYQLELGQQTARITRVASGDHDCCIDIQKIGNDIGYSVQSGLHDQLHLYGGQKLIELPTAIIDWSAAFTRDSDEIIVAVAKGDVNHPTEVYTTTASGGALVRLSSHGSMFDDEEHSVSSVFIHCQTLDDTERIEAVFHTPIQHKNQQGLPSRPLSTIVSVHGGPYYRNTNTFNPSHFYWLPVALKAGYAVMLPNYRGSSGRGDRFARYSQGGMGKYDQPDVIALTQHCIEQGYIDKDNALICGWSQGGYLTYLSSVRNGMHGFGWKYKAAIAGAGVTDWDTMTFTSDDAYMEADLAGGAAWMADKTDISGRSGSAIWEFKKAAEAGVIPPILMLHGQKDERVPIEQARAFRRGLQWAKLPFELVEYPREGHFISERRHIVDMLKRSLRFTGQHLKAN